MAMKGNGKQKISAFVVGGFLSLLVVGVSGSTTISIPNTFTAGEVASAAAVNANFTYLGDAIQTQSGRVDKLELLNSPVSEYVDLPGFVVDVGNSFTFNTDTFTMAQMTVTDPATGSQYQVIYPNQTGTPNAIRLGKFLGAPYAGNQLGASAPVTSAPAPFGYGSVSGYSVVFSRNIQIDLDDNGGVLDGLINVQASVVLPGGAGFGLVVAPVAPLPATTAGVHTQYEQSFLAALQLMRYVRVTAL